MGAVRADVRVLIAAPPLQNDTTASLLAAARAHQGRKIFFPEPQGHVHQADEHRHLHQGADDRGEGLPRPEAEDRHRHRNGQLKVVAGGGKGQGGGNPIARPGFGRHIKRHKEHDEEINGQGDGDAHHVQGEFHNILALEGEHHHDGEQEGDEGNGADFGQEFFFIPLEPLAPDQEEPGEHAAEEGETQVDHHAFRHLEDGDPDFHARGDPQPGGQHRYKNIGVHGKEQHLEDGVEGHQPGAVFGIALGQVVPDDDHGDTAGQADDDQTHHVIRVTPEKSDGQQEHEDGADHPVLD